MKRHQRGSMTIFFAGLLLPLALFAVAISLDLAVYFHERDRLQAELDRSALAGAESLPNAREAERVVAERLATRGLVAGISTRGGSIEIALEREYRPSFTGIVGAAARLPISVFSRAGKKPVRIVAALDRSMSLAPNRFRGEVWGDPDKWPAPAGVARSDVQRCFNPLFSPLKRVASILAARAVELPESSVTPVLFPGMGRPIDLAESGADDLCSELSERSPYRLEVASLESRAIWSAPVNLDAEGDFGVALGWVIAVLLDPQAANFTGRRLAVFLAADVPRAGGERFPDGPSREALRNAFARSETLCHRVGATCEVLYLTLGDRPRIDLEPRLEELERLGEHGSLRLTARAALSMESAWQLAKSFSEKVYLEQ